MALASQFSVGARRNATGNRPGYGRTPCLIIPWPVAGRKSARDIRCSARPLPFLVLGTVGVSRNPAGNRPGAGRTSLPAIPRSVADRIAAGAYGAENESGRRLVKSGGRARVTWGNLLTIYILSLMTLDL